MKHADALWTPGYVIDPIYPRRAAIRVATVRTQETADWYEFVLGVRPVERETGGGPVVLVNGACSVELLEQPPALRDAASGRPPFCVYDCELDLMLSYLRLRGRGIEPSKAVTDGTGYALWYADPDGNAVILGWGPLDSAATGLDGERAARPVDFARLVDERSRGSSNPWFGVTPA